MNSRVGLLFDEIEQHWLRAISENIRWYRKTFFFFFFYISIHIIPKSRLQALAFRKSKPNSNNIFKLDEIRDLFALQFCSSTRILVSCFQSYIFINHIMFFSFLFMYSLSMHKRIFSAIYFCKFILVLFSNKTFSQITHMFVFLFFFFLILFYGL